MDELAYKTWRQLHLRVVCGETLSLAEQSAYEEGERQLDAEEHLLQDVHELQELKVQIAAMEQEHARLLEHKARLDVEIAKLEANLNPRIRQMLEVGK
jgi:hypothetical protein